MPYRNSSQPCQNCIRSTLSSGAHYQHAFFHQNKIQISNERVLLVSGHWLCGKFMYDVTTFYHTSSTIHPWKYKSITITHRFRPSCCLIARMRMYADAQLLLSSFIACHMRLQMHMHSTKKIMIGKCARARYIYKCTDREIRPKRTEWDGYSRRRRINANERTCTPESG